MTPDTRQVGKQFYCQICRVEKTSAVYGKCETEENWNASKNLIGRPLIDDLRLGPTENAELRNFLVGSEFFEFFNAENAEPS